MTSPDIIKIDFAAAIEAAVKFAEAEKNGVSYAAPRVRKLDAATVIKMVTLFGGNSLQKKIRDYPGADCAVSSFVEARERVDSAVFYDALMRFNAQYDPASAPCFKGKRLLGLDGTCINTAFAPASPSFMPSTTSSKGGYNQYKATIYLDLLSHIPVDIALQPISRQDELGSAMGMLAFNPPPTPSVCVCDRLYSAYSFIADIIAADNLDFVIRTKQGNGALKPIQGLPMEEFDIDKQIILTDSQSKASKEQGHIYISTGSKRGKANSPKTYISRFSQPLPYVMNLRIVRVKLPTGTYSTLLSSLSRNEFSKQDLAQIYKYRWNQELFFRHVKNDCALNRMHSKKEDFSRQQIYAAFLFSSAVWKIVNSVAIQQNESNVYEYAVNIKMASYLVREFLRTPDADGAKLLRELTRYVVPIRPDRNEERRLVPKSFVPFTYRIA